MLEPTNSPLFSHSVSDNLSRLQRYLCTVYLKKSPFPPTPRLPRLPPSPSLPFHTLFFAFGSSFRPRNRQTLAACSPLRRREPLTVRTLISACGVMQAMQSCSLPLVYHTLPHTWALGSGQPRDANPDFWLQCDAGCGTIIARYMFRRELNVSNRTVYHV
jgi:hypothetical protein